MSPRQDALRLTRRRTSAGAQTSAEAPVQTVQYAAWTGASAASGAQIRSLKSRTSLQPSLTAQRRIDAGPRSDAPGSRCDCGPGVGSDAWRGQGQQLQNAVWDDSDGGAVPSEEDPALQEALQRSLRT